jgi:hypothetical protein
MGKKKLPVQLIKYPIHPLHPIFRHTTISSIQVLATPQLDFTPKLGYWAAVLQELRMTSKVGMEK